MVNKSDPLKKKVSCTALEISTDETMGNTPHVPDAFAEVAVAEGTNQQSVLRTRSADAPNAGRDNRRATRGRSTHKQCIHRAQGGLITVWDNSNAVVLTLFFSAL